MLPSVDCKGTAKVRNKGVDVVLYTDKDTVDAAFNASRYLSVTGISAAVVEETCVESPDIEILRYYEKTTKGFIILTSKLYQAVTPLLQQETKREKILGADPKELIKQVAVVTNQWKREA